MNINETLELSEKNTEKIGGIPKKLLISQLIFDLVIANMVLN